MTAPNERGGLPPSGTIGAASELVVAADLLLRGIPTFRAQSPSCPCDLVVLCGGLLARIEVRTATRRPTGLLNFGLRPDDIGRFDVLALVVNGRPSYYPEIERWAGGERWSDEDWRRLKSPPLDPGRERVLAEQTQTAARLRSEGVAYDKIARHLGVSPSTARKLAKRVTP